jgi:hypothetical protein
MKNKKFFSVMLIGLLALGLVLSGCPTDSPSDDVKVDFAAAGTNAFTLTLSKGEWKEPEAGKDYYFSISQGLFYEFYTVTDATGDFEGTNNIMIGLSNALYTENTVERQADKKVMKVTITQQNEFTGTFKVKLDTDTFGLANYVLAGLTDIEGYDLIDMNTGNYDSKVILGTNEQVIITIPAGTP